MDAILTVLSVPFTFVLSYYAAAVIQTVSHGLFGHYKRVMPIYRAHTHGHHAAYPRSELLADQLIPADRHVMWWFALPVGALALVVEAHFGTAVLLAHVAGVAFALWWHVTLHEHYHLRGSPFERFAWFRRRRELHFVHHRRVRSNYAIAEPWIDHVLGTYRTA